ncbi:MAG: long-chain fatty acid--CoA ligase [Spirochaetia bacterium]|nr:long-chain fatty acid--CoA ligase [Spirochaetia bacterium]
MQFPWLNQYDPGVSHHLDYPMESIPELFKQATLKYPDRTCVSFLGTHIRFSEIEASASTLAEHLAVSGVQPGDRVFLLLPNMPQFVVAYYAVLKCGGVVVPASPLDTASEINHKVRDSGAVGAIYLDLLFKNMEASLSLVKFSISCDLRDCLSPLKRFLLGIRMKFMKHPKPGSRSTQYRQILSSKIKSPNVTVKPAYDSLATIMYTGGTTGVSKGVMLSHKALVANMTQAKAWGQVTSEDRALCALPFFHGFGLSIGLNTTFTSGGCMILMPRWDVRVAIRHIAKDRITLFAGVPTMYVAMTHHADFAKLKSAHLRGCFVGAAPVPENLKQTFQSKTGGTLIEGYGLTEAVTAKSANPYLGQKKLKSIGIPWPDTQFRIVDEKGESVSAGIQGEIIIRSPDVMMGYWQNESATSEVLRDGWLYTGDIGWMDEQGYFYIVDRKKDLIISGGYNVYPTEIEEVLYSHPAVLEACVIGVPDEKMGELPVAYVVLKENQKTTQEELIGFLRQHLIQYKVPRHFEFRGSLPKSPIGKILRKELKNASADLRSR